MGQRLARVDYTASESMIFVKTKTLAVFIVVLYMSVITTGKERNERSAYIGRKRTSY